MKGSAVRGWVVRHYGEPDAMHWDQVPDPVPGPGQLQIAVKASGVNYAETRMRAGTYYTNRAPPFVIGMECAGVVECVGEDVTAFKPGDRVAGRARGAHAEKAVLEAALAFPLPSTMTFVEGAAIPVGWHSAWHALVTIAAVQPGQRVLIETVASSVGSAALQIAKHRGCWVAGTSSRDNKLAAAKAAGADAAYNYQTEDVAQRVLADTEGHGLDVCLQILGAETIDSLIAAMANEGRVVMFGAVGGRKVAFDLVIAARNISLQGVSIVTSPRYRRETVKTFVANALPLFAAGTFKAVVDTVLPVTEIVKAHAMIAAHRHYGKVVLTAE